MFYKYWWSKTALSALNIPHSDLKISVLFIFSTVGRHFCPVYKLRTLDLVTFQLIYAIYPVLHQFLLYCPHEL